MQIKFLFSAHRVLIIFCGIVGITEIDKLQQQQWQQQQLCRHNSLNCWRRIRGYGYGISEKCWFCGILQRRNGKKKVIWDQISFIGTFGYFWIFAGYLFSLFFVFREGGEQMRCFPPFSFFLLFPFSSFLCLSERKKSRGWIIDSWMRQHVGIFFLFLCDRVCVYICGGGKTWASFLTFLAFQESISIR